jgi:hypothetical protein
MFCNDRAGTKEHVWPKWLIASVDPDPTSPTEYWNSVHSPPKRWVGPEFTTRRVCKACNNGWMSELENGARSIVGGLINDLSLWLDGELQRRLTQWAIKTTMVIEGAQQDKNNFYSIELRHNFRSTLSPPPDTALWLGRCAQSKVIHGEAKELPARRLDGCATTFVMGRLVLQVLSVKRKPEAGPGNLKIHLREGPWGTKLLQVWPIQTERVNWPPPESFSDPDGLLDLRGRFAVEFHRYDGLSTVENGETPAGLTPAGGPNAPLKQR